jgi:hypothetical protein
MQPARSTRLADQGEGALTITSPLDALAPAEDHARS